MHRKGELQALSCCGLAIDTSCCECQQVSNHHTMYTLHKKVASDEKVNKYAKYVAACGLVLYTAILHINKVTLANSNFRGFQLLLIV